nr:acyltransferase domain-containing protein [uncultured Blautia sp.]
MKICFLFPGQGTQKPGMLRELGRLSQEEEHVFEVGTKVSGIDLKELCLHASDKTLKEALNTQLAVTAMNIAYYSRLKTQGLTPALTAGHSLGQLSALYAAGVIDLENLFLLTKKEGN